MKKLLLIAALCGGSLCFGQNLDEIVNKHIESVGGAANWNKIKSLKMDCSLKAQGADIKISIAQIDRVAMRQDIDAMGMKGYSIITEKEGWVFMPFQGHTKPEAMTADDLRNSQDELNLRDEFITYKELGKKIEYIGTDEIDGLECHKIKMTDKNDQETTYFIDTESYYVIKQIDKIKANGKEMENVTSFSNFEKLPEGIVYPMAISSGWGNMDITKLEINPTIDESVFKLPQ